MRRKNKRNRLFSLRFIRRRNKNNRSKMKKNKNIKRQDAIENAETFIEQMKAMDYKKLSKHLDLFRVL